MTDERWTMPEWMEPYRQVLEANTMCGESAEELVHRLATDRNLSRTNAYVYVDAVGMSARVGLLTRLHAAGMLK